LGTLNSAYNGAPDVLLQCFAEEVRADASCLLVREGAHEAPRAVSVWDPAGRGEPHQWLDGEFLTRLLHSDEPILEPDDGEAGQPASSLPAQGISIERALGAVALSPAGVQAILCAGFARRPPPDPAQLLWAADSFAAAAALCVAGTGSFTEALSSSRRDPLTGCLSYAGLMEALGQEIARSTRHHHRLSCCFLDLDGFKQVNETAGHLEGNRVLAAVGARVRGGVRNYDLVGRFGGDEFVVILPETRGRLALQLAQRLRGRVRGPTSGEAEAPSIEVSIGVAEWAEGMSSEDLLEIADRSLRIAKERGGAMVMSGPPDQPVESIHEIMEDVTELIHSDGQQERAPIHRPSDDPADEVQR